jgi:hypothetical protein
MESRIRRDPLVVTQSDLGAFKVCRRQWYYGCYLGLRLKASPVVGPLTLGTRVHLALQGHYTDGRDIVDYYNQIAEEEYAELIDSKVVFDVVQWQSETELGRIMLEGYVEWLQETGADAEYEVIGAERKLTYVLPVEGPFGTVDVELRGKIDLRVRNVRNGSRLVVDHKTTAHFANLTATADRNEQLLFYMLLERLVDGEHENEWVQGAMLNMLRKVKRSMQSKPPYYDRLEVHKTDTDLRSYWTRLQGMLQDYVRVVQMLDNEYDHRHAAYPTPLGCRFCPFKHPCTLTDDGSRVDDMLESLYVQRDPHERYETEPASIMDPVTVL